MRHSLIILSLVAMLAVGCATTTPGPVIEPPVPGAGEQLIDFATIMVDSSLSMRTDRKFIVEKQIVRTLIEAMPEGSYEAGIFAFSGASRSDWQVMPLSSFNRSALRSHAESLAYLDDVTPLNTGLEAVAADIGARQGQGAIILFSDGAADRESSIMAAEQLAAQHPNVCLYTIRIKAQPRDQRLLEEMSSAAACGQSFYYKDLEDEDKLASIVETIFFRGAPEPTPAPAPAPKPGDADGDGVMDDVDQCPNTPAGVTVDERGCWVLRNINFDLDKYDIKPEFDPFLNEAAAVLKANPEVVVRIEGHTDSRHTEAYNQKLSENRANAVRRALIQRGIADARMKAEGFGETKPMAPNDTEENMYLNRRVELHVIE